MRISRMRFGRSSRGSVLCAFLCSAVVAAAQQQDTAVAARAEGLARAGQTVEAESLAAAYLKVHPGSVPVNVVLGELSAYRRAWQQAMGFYETALSGAPSDPAAQHGEQSAALAWALHQRNSDDGEGALSTLERARSRLPQNVPVLLAIAVQAQTLHRLTTALGAVDEALSVDPENDRAQYIAAGIYFDRGESILAAKLYERFLAKHPDDASAHFGLGRALRVQQKNADAERELQTSIRLQPVQTEAYYQLGLIAQAAGRDDEAKADYARVLDRMPNHAGALTGMGEMLYQSHAYAQARDYLQRATAADPAYEKAHYYLGLTLRRVGEAEAADQELKLAMKLASEQQGKGTPQSAQ